MAMRMTISLSEQLASRFLTLAPNRERAATIAWGSAGPPAHYSAYDGSGQNYRCHYRPAPYRGEIPSTQQEYTASSAKIQAILTALAQILEMT